MDKCWERTNKEGDRGGWNSTKLPAVVVIIKMINIAEMTQFYSYMSEISHLNCKGN
jgi:hypothetical protein